MYTQIARYGLFLKAEKAYYFNSRMYTDCKCGKLVKNIVAASNFSSPMYTDCKHGHQSSAVRGLSISTRACTRMARGME